MNFGQFEALYWIARLGSFHAAARHLKTSQPAISARIRGLEHQLGVELFDRSEHKARPTAKGQELFHYAAQLIGIAAEITQRVGTREALSGRVRLGVTSVPALTWLPNLMERVARSYPGIVIEFTVDSSEVLHERIGRGQQSIATLHPPPTLDYVIAYASVGLSASTRIVADAAKSLIGQKPDLQSYYSANEYVG